MASDATELNERNYADSNTLPSFCRCCNGCARTGANATPPAIGRSISISICPLILLQLFNPAVATLRLIQRASELEKVQKILGCSRSSLGSLERAPWVFDPQLLLGIIGELAAELRPLGRDPRLAEIRQVITLVDGTLLRTLPSVAEAMWLTTRTGTKHGAWRLHTHFDLDKYVPTQMDLTDGATAAKAMRRTCCGGIWPPTTAM